MERAARASPFTASAVFDGLVAGAVAWLASEVPSTVHAVATGADWRRTDRAAGNLVLPASAPPARLLAVGTVLRVIDAANWGVVLSRWLDRRHPVAHGAGVGLGLFGFQYVLIGRLKPLVRQLPALPQLADHLVLGMVTGAALMRRWRR